MRCPTHRTYAAAPSGASSTPTAMRQETFLSRTTWTAAVAQSAATTAAPTGRVSPASEASRPALTHRPVRTAYSDQAASAVNKDSLYAIDCTIPTGSTAHSATAQTPARLPYSSSATRKIPQAAQSDASQLTSRPASAYDRGLTADTSRSSHGSSGKNARFECTVPSGRRTSQP